VKALILVSLLLLSATVVAACGGDSAATRAEKWMAGREMDLGDPWPAVIRDPECVAAGDTANCTATLYWPSDVVAELQDGRDGKRATISVNGLVCDNHTCKGPDPKITQQWNPLSGKDCSDRFAVCEALAEDAGG
jgi:hypothetical protein